MRKKQFEPLLITEFVEDSFHLPPHEQNYYELVYIRSGHGSHIINAFELPYETGDLFIVSPADKHYFKITEKTHFLFILFTDSYFLHNRPHKKVDTWVMELMNDRSLRERKLCIDERDRSIFVHLLEAVRLYHSAVTNLSAPWLLDQLLAIFGRYKEISELQRLPQERAALSDTSIATYIHQHIFAPEYLQVKTIAQQFHIAPSYFGIYFKKNFGSSLRDYIHTYRIELIENRLKSTAYSLKQIAEELGFVDESHLSHFYKRARGFSPKLYRQKLQQIDADSK